MRVENIYIIAEVWPTRHELAGSRETVNRKAASFTVVSQKIDQTGVDVQKSFREHKLG